MMTDQALFALYARRSNELPNALLNAGARTDGVNRFRINPSWGGACHQSHARTGWALQVTLNPDGTVHAWCYACDLNGLRSIDALLGWSAQGFPDRGNRNLGPILPRTPAPAPPPAYRLPVHPTGAGVVTLADVLALPRWFPCRGKMGYHGGAGGESWVHTVSPDRLPQQPGQPPPCPVRAAADGCVANGRRANDRPTVYQPQMRYHQASRHAGTLPGADGVGLATGASESFLYHFPLAALDVDYKPGADPDGAGMRQRDAVRDTLEGLGCPILPSTSGNGFHALWLLADGDCLACPREGIWRLPEVLPGFGYDLYLPGARGLLVLRVAKAGLPPDMTLPTLTLREMDVIITPAPNTPVSQNAPYKRRTAPRG